MLALAAAALTVSTAGCGGGDSKPAPERRVVVTPEATVTATADPAAAPDGLQAVSGYADCDGCGRGCTGAVPDELRRELRLPRVRKGERCPVSPARRVSRDFGAALGRGPVYPILAPSLRSPRAPQVVRFQYPPGEAPPFPGRRWGGLKVLWVGRASYDGPVLIRGRRLDGREAIGFGKDEVPFAELQFAPGDAASAGSSANWRDWPSYTRLRGSGCYGYQVDGADFAEVVVFRGVAAPR